MHALVVKVRPDGGTDLVVDRVDSPSVGPGQVRVRVRAGSVNRADLLLRQGWHGADTSAGQWVCGLDAAGEVVEVAEDVESLAAGDRVMTMVAGGLAEEVVVDAGLPVRLPDSWTFAQGAAAVVGLMTEHHAIATAARMRAGETVLVTGATSGVGLQALQLARSMGAERVLGTARSDRGTAALHAAGAHEVVLAPDGQYAAAVAALSPDGVDVVIDHLGGETIDQALAAAAVRGRIVSVGRMAGPSGYLDVEELARKRVEIIGVTFRTRDLAEKVAIADGVRALDLGDLAPLIDRTMSWERAEEAHQLLLDSSVLGKVVLEVA